MGFGDPLPDPATPPLPERRSAWVPDWRRLAMDSPHKYQQKADESALATVLRDYRLSEQPYQRRSYGLHNVVEEVYRATLGRVDALFKEVESYLAWHVHGVEPTALRARWDHSLDRMAQRVLTEVVAQGYLPAETPRATILVTASIDPGLSGPGRSEIVRGQPDDGEHRQSHPADVWLDPATGIEEVQGLVSPSLLGPAREMRLHIEVGVRRAV